MSIEVGADYVQDGLFSLYDPKSAKSYPGSGATLFDVINGHNLTIVGSPTFNSAGYFTFANNQVTDYMENATYPHPTTAVSYNVWFRSNFTSNQQTPFMYSVGGDNQMVCFITSATNWQPISINSAYNVGVTTMLNTWVNLSWTRTSATGFNVFYRDGVQLDTRTADAGTNVTTNGRLLIAQEVDGTTFDVNQNLDGDFAFLAIYNRILTPAEVKQNFHALRGRFGI